MMVRPQPDPDDFILNTLVEHAFVSHDFLPWGQWISIWITLLASWQMMSRFSWSASSVEQIQIWSVYQFKRLQKVPGLMHSICGWKHICPSLERPLWWVRESGHSRSGLRKSIFWYATSYCVWYFDHCFTIYLLKCDVSIIALKYDVFVWVHPLYHFTKSGTSRTFFLEICHLLFCTNIKTRFREAHARMVDQEDQDTRGNCAMCITERQAAFFLESSYKHSLRYFDWFLHLLNNWKKEPTGQGDQTPRTWKKFWTQFVLS